MKGNVMSESELAFARIVWENAPLPSGELVTRCNEELGWKKPTTYTVLRNLCQAGIFENKQAMVSVLVSEEDYLARESEQIVNERFGGSISHFVTAFVFAERNKTAILVIFFRSTAICCDWNIQLWESKSTYAIAIFI